MESLDIDFNFVLGFFYRGMVSFLATFVLIMFMDWRYVIFVAVFFYLCFKQFLKFMKVQTEIKRMIKIVESPLISIVTEAWSSREQIKISNKEDYILNQFNSSLDLYTHVKGHELWGNSWIKVRLKHFTFTIISLITLSVVLNIKWGWVEFTSANSIGLLMTYLTELSRQVANLIWSSTSTYAGFSSIERLKEYIEDTNC